MPVRRGRSRKGDRRIDAAIDHFGLMGYLAPKVRSAVAALLKEYLGPAAWPFLEEGSYHVVQEKLLEMEEEEKKHKEDQQQLLLEHHPQEEQPQQQEPAVDEAPPESNMTALEVHNDVPAEAESSDAEVEDPMFIEPPALQAVIPLSAATRPPYHGWLSESEDEEKLAGQQHEVDVPSPGSLCKRKRLE